MKFISQMQLLLQMLTIHERVYYGSIDYYL